MGQHPVTYVTNTLLVTHYSLTHDPLTHSLLWFKLRYATISQKQNGSSFFLYHWISKSLRSHDRHVGLLSDELLRIELSEYLTFVWEIFCKSTFDLERRKNYPLLQQLAACALFLGMSAGSRSSTCWMLIFYYWSDLQRQMIKCSPIQVK